MKFAGSRLLAALFGVLSCLVSLWADPVTITNAVVGEGIILGTGTYESGTEVTLRAVPQVDWKFEKWEGVDAGMERQNPLILAVLPGLHPKAVFRESLGEGLFKGGAVIAWGDNANLQSSIPADLGRIKKVSAGWQHSLALTMDGYVRAWGDNSFAQRDVPPGLSNVVDIAASREWSFAVTRDGQVFSWGKNAPAFGKVTNAVHVASENYTTLVLHSDGRVSGAGYGLDGDSRLPAIRDAVGIGSACNGGYVIRGGGHVTSFGDLGQATDYVPTLQNVIQVEGSSHSAVALFQDGTTVATTNCCNQAVSATASTLRGIREISVGGSYEDSRFLALDWFGILRPVGVPSGYMPPEVPGIFSASLGPSHALAVKPPKEEGIVFVGEVDSVRIVRLGDSVTLNSPIVGATNVAWQRDGVLVPGQALPRLNLGAVRLADAGSYRLFAENNFSARLSRPTFIGVYELTAASGGEVVAVRVGSDQVRFTARAAKGFKLDHWEQDLAGSELEKVVRFTPERPAWRVGAVFVPAQSVTVKPSIQGAGMVLGGGTFDERAIVTLRAVPQVDWKFERWEGGAQGDLQTNPIRFEAASGIQPVAVFGPSKGSGRFKGGTVIGGPAELDGVTAIAAGENHGVALKNDGKVVAWGSQPDNLSWWSDVVAISAGNGNSLGLTSAGTVLWVAQGWGGPAELGDVIAIAAGRNHHMVLRSNSSILRWGPGSPSTQILGASNVVAIAAGEGWDMALQSDGRVVGNAGSGWLSPPSDLNDIVAIAAGGKNGMALRSDGTVRAWGILGALSPAPPNDLDDVVSISAGEYHSLALRADGRVVEWGEKSMPQGLENVVAIAAGRNQSLALVSDHLGVVRTPPAQTIVDEGSQILLQAQVARATRYQWYRDGQPIDGQVSVWLRVPSSKKSDSGTYELVAANDDDAVLTLPVKVKVLSPGSPRVSINGKQIPDYVRVGDQAEVSFTTSFPNGQIFYTLDGANPGLDSRPYSVPFIVTNSVVVRAFAISGDFTQEATNEPVSVQIVPTFRVASSVEGGGRIDRAPALDRYLQDDVLTVRAVPNEGWRFLRWEGDLDGSFPERNLAMSRDKSVRAIFEAIPKFTLNTQARGGSVSGGGTYYQGTSVSMSAVPAASWSFLNWTGDFVGTETSFSWMVDGPASFEARFGTKVSTLATGPGTVRLEPDQPLYAYGSQVKVIPVPDAGNYLALWGEAGAGQPRTEWVLTVTNGSPRVTALFRTLAADKVALTAQSTLGGRITQPAVDGLYAKGSSVTITAVPDTGYEFTGWTGDATGTEPSVTLTLDTSKTVRAEFRRIGVQTHPLVVTVDGPGTVRRIPDLGAYETGSEVELVADPAVDAAFTGWTGAATSTQKRIRVTVSGPTTIQAAFLPIHPVVTEVRGEGQVLLSPPDGRYLAGTALALTAKPADGWGFVQWSGDLSTTGQEASLKVDAPKRAIAEFARLGTLTTKVIGSGTITRTPEGQSFLPGTQVTLRAEPTAGWKFVKWSGGAVGTNAEVQVTVGRTEAIVAEFTDGESPALVLSEPQSGTVTVEKFRLKGTATDNVALASVGWSWNGAPQSELKLTDGRFETEELTLKVGANQLEVLARDAAGNESRVVREVIWTPIRSLQVGTALEAQEGQRLVFPVTLSAPGDVGGLTFQLRYDPTLLTDAQFEWGSLVGQSINNLNLSTSGEIGASFSLAGLALPEGTNPVATVSFRARSVPAVTNAVLVPVIVSVATPAGDALATGNAAAAGKGRILPRKIRGDNNANQRIDVGDAVVISRLQLGLEEVRPWDVPLNDLNDTGTLDNGDVIKALRIVVGLDLQPKAMPRSGGGSELSVERGELRGEGEVRVPESYSGTGGAFDSVSQLSTLHSQRRSLRPAGSNTNDVATLEFPDGPVAQVGKPYRVVVKLLRAGAPISGVSLTLNHPSAFKVISKEVGPLVPSDALPLWGEASAGMNLAAIRSTLWPSSTGVMAVLTLLPTEEITTRPQWAVELVKGEVTGAGFDIRALDDVRGEIRSESQPPVEPKVVLPTPDSNGGPLALDIEAATGAAIVLETTTDLSAWTEDRRLTGQGAGKPVRVTVTPDPNSRVRFWRVRVP